MRGRVCVVLNWNEYNSLEHSCKVKMVITLSLPRGAPHPNFCSEPSPVSRGETTEEWKQSFY